MEKRKEINLLMIIGQFYPLVGGAEIECKKLSKKLIKEGVSVTLLTQKRDGLPEYEEVGGIPVYRKIKGWHLFGLTYMISVLHFLLKHRKEFDIIQCFGLYLFIPPAILIKYLFRKRIVARLECSGRFGDFWRVKQLKWKKLIIFSSRRVDRVIFISNDIKNELIENRFSHEKLVYMPNSVDSDHFKPSERHVKEKQKNICFVGRLEEQKGLEYLIKAMDIIRSKENDVKLFIVGEGKQRDTLEDLCKKLKLKNHIIFVGSSDDVLAYYQNARVFVLPSISEGMPLTLLEAMSCGLPVIATSVGGNAEVLGLSTEEPMMSDYHVGENGVLVEPKDVDSLAKALLRLLQDEGLSRELGKKARKYVKNKFSLDKVANEYVNLYHTLM